MPKIGRNHPCPCKSGKKYKKCCASPTAASGQSQPTFEVVYGHAWKRPPADQTVKTVRVFKRIP